MKRYMVTMLMALTFTGLSTLAQSHLNREQLQQFEGYYRSTKVKDLVVQITIQDDTLVAKPQWVKMVVHLLPKAELVFHTIEAVEAGPIDIAFSRDSTGAIAALDLSNMGVKWLREKDYKPLVRKVMDHTPDQLKRYEGIYRLNREGSRFLQFFVKDNNLVLKQVWDNTELPFHPENAADFFTDNIPLFTLKFTSDQQGNITQVLAFGRDVWVRTKQPDLSPAVLDAAAGKFQSKDDPDNQVVISVKAGHLVVKQLWDNKDIILQALSDDYFYNPEELYNLQLRKGSDGKVKDIVLLDASVFVRL